MDRLWAGWRSAYVAMAANGTLAPDHREGSIFTRILASGLDDAETFIVHRGEHAFVILNGYPYTSGHVLVMPYREVASLEELSAEETAELWALTTDGVIANWPCPATVPSLAPNRIANAMVFPNARRGSSMPSAR